MAKAKMAGAGKRKHGGKKKGGKKKKTGGKRKHHKKHHGGDIDGGNIFTDAWDGIKSVGEKVYNVGKKVNNFLKDTKLAGTIASVIPHPKAQALGAFLKQHGYGQKGGSRLSAYENQNVNAGII